MKKIITLITILMPMINCGNLSNTIKTIKVFPVKSLLQLPDSTFIGNTVLGLSCSGKGKFVISDYQNNRVIILDSCLNFLKTFGKSGRGPGEFIGAGPNLIKGDTIYVFDEFSKRINIFSLKDGFISTVLVADINFTSLSRFSILKRGILIFPDTFNDEYIFSVDVSGSINKFPLRKKRLKTGSRNISFIFSWGRHIVRVLSMSPVVEVYDNHLNLLYVKDFSDSRNISEEIAHYYLKKNRLLSNNAEIVGIQFFNDAYVYKSHLFLLFYNYKNSYPTCNSVMVCKLKHLHIEPVLIYRLLNNYDDDNSYNIFSDRIAVHNNYLITYDSISGKILLYEVRY